jgi:hypothetical protein
MKRDITDELYSIVIRRYKDEFPDRELDNQFMDRIWYSIYGKLNSEGETAAREYVMNAKLWE